MAVPKKKREANKEVYKELIVETFGNYNAIAILVDKDRSTVWEIIQNDPELKRLADNQIERIKDQVEQTLVKKAIDGDNACLIFYAKTKMRDRGYSERYQSTELEKLLAGLPAPVATALSQILDELFQSRRNPQSHREDS